MLFIFEECMNSIVRESHSSSSLLYISRDKNPSLFGLDKVIN